MSGDVKRLQRLEAPHRWHSGEKIVTDKAPIFHVGGASADTSRHCDHCGLRVPAFLAGAKCPDGNNPAKCEMVRDAYLMSRSAAECPALKGKALPLLEQHLDAIGITDGVRQEWWSAYRARSAAEGHLSIAAPDWLTEARDWVMSIDTDGGKHSDERMLALIAAIGVEPPLPATMADISEWHARLASRAAELLAQVGDYEGQDE